MAPASKPPDASYTWKVFSQSLSEMNAFRKGYAADSSILYGDIETNIMNSDDVIFMRTQNSYEWASVAMPLLEVYLNVSRAESTKNALNKILDLGKTQLNANKGMLKESLKSFNAVTTRIRNLQSQFNNRFDRNRKLLIIHSRRALASDKDQPLDAREKNLIQQLLAKMEDIQQFGVNLEITIIGVVRKMKEAKEKLKDEIGKIENLRSKINPLKTVWKSGSASNDDVTASVHNLIAECKKYRERHLIKTNLI